MKTILIYASFLCMVLGLAVPLSAATMTVQNSLTGSLSDTNYDDFDWSNPNDTTANISVSPEIDSASSMPLFDSNIGTLTSVNVDFSLSYWVSGDFDRSDFQFGLFFRNDQTGQKKNVANVMSGVVSNAGASYSVTGAMAMTPADYSTFLGSGSLFVGLDGYSNIEATGRYLSNGLMQFGYTLGITYTYAAAAQAAATSVAAVPLPSGFVLLATGLLSAGLSARRKRLAGILNG